MYNNVDRRLDGEDYTSDHRLLGTSGSEDDGEAQHDYTRSWASQSRTKFFKPNILGSCNLVSALYNFRLNLRVLPLALSVCLVALLGRILATHTDSDVAVSLPQQGQTFEPDRPLSGAFARFPSLSALPARQRRMTIVGAWNEDTVPSYLRHFLYTVQLNADVLDLLMINRIREAGGKCINLEEAGIDISWGGNIKWQCMDNIEWKKRHADFMCSQEYGWNCTSTEYDAVVQEHLLRPDEKNYNWRPFRGYVFRDLFPHPELPFWAWLDHDLFVGNFQRYPFNILSQLSFLSGSAVQPEQLFMAGQLTAFNFDSQALGRAWKKFPALKSPAHFTKYISGKMPESAEEFYWSYGYTRSDMDLPGHELSWGIYPDMHGDDYFSRKWARRHSNETYIISGRDILLMPTSYSRETIEGVIKLERQAPIDDLGGIGWTTGEDGSAYLIDRPSLSSEEAKILAMKELGNVTHAHAHAGIVEDVEVIPGCNSISKQGGAAWKQCVPFHPLTTTMPPVMRSSVIRFVEQQPGHVLRRLEIDDRPRGYERKLIRHNLISKKMEWMEFPPFDITEDMVLAYNFDSLEVFRMGPSRNETIYRRSGKGGNIG